LHRNTFDDLLKDMRFLFFPVLAATVLLATACAKPAPAYRAEQFSAVTPFEYRTPLDPPQACVTAQRALLSQGYQVDDQKPQSIRGRKLFQPEPGHHMELNITLVCLPIPAGSVVYANALQTRYELKASATSAGVSVAGIGSISLPWLSEKESLMKVSEETVADPDFYRRLFQLIEAMDE
jgi:hypothetical protein